MIAYKIQLRYVVRDKIRDKIQSETKFSVRKIREKDFLSEKKFVSKKIVGKNLSQTLSWISTAQSELSRTNRCLSSLIGTHRNKVY